MTSGAHGRANGEGTAAPLDLGHLERQTFGDRALRDEVLAMFLDQLDAAGGELAAADADRRRALAHRLKGAARAVGAFAVADCAELIEREAADATLLARLDALAEEARRCIRALGG